MAAIDVKYANVSTYRQLKLKLEPEKYLFVPHGGWSDRVWDGRKFLTRLRSGNSELRINTGRWNSLPIAERICRLCADGTEDERHFLLSCQFLKKKRQSFYDSFDSILSQSHQHALRFGVPVFIHSSQLTPVTQFQLFMGGMIPEISKTGKEKQIRTLILTTLSDWRKLRAQHIEFMDNTIATINT